jgi:hypothetical protein
VEHISRTCIKPNLEEGSLLGWIVVRYYAVQKYVAASSGTVLPPARRQRFAKGDVKNFLAVSVTPGHTVQDTDDIDTALPGVAVRPHGYLKKPGTSRLLLPSSFLRQVTQSTQDVRRTKMVGHVLNHRAIESTSPPSRRCNRSREQPLYAPLHSN